VPSKSRFACNTDMPTVAAAYTMHKALMLLAGHAGSLA